MESFHVFQDLYNLYEDVHKKATALNLFEMDSKLIDDFDLWSRQIDGFQRDFLKYRSHLAQAEDEGIFDAEFYENLKPGQAVVIMDFKMKILSAMYREGHGGWFSKRGFSCLGALVLTPSRDNPDSHEAVYHIFISNDTTQDAQYVNTVKEYLYSCILPEYGIKEVHFRCDGAGCFVAAGIKAEFAHWKERTGIEEVSYKNNVPGKGKSPLDCQFGVFTQKLNRAVDEGESFDDVNSLYDICLKYPLKNTHYHLLDLNRSKVNFDKDVHRAIVNLNIGRKYYLLLNEGDHVRGFTHSRHGEGESIPLLKGTSSVCHFIALHIFKIEYRPSSQFDLKRNGIA